MTLLILLLSLLLLALGINSSLASTEICEKIDGDCPDDCLAAGMLGKENWNARFTISPSLLHIKTEEKAKKAEEYLKTQGNITRLDNPFTGLHTTMYYFCCHTKEDKKTITSALHDMKWEPFKISYDSFACNLDHDNSTVYLHALPSDQSKLFNWARTVEAAVKAKGIDIPKRETLYHMTLARVGYDYPTDSVVQYFLDNKDDWDFGTLDFHQFEMNGETFKANK